MGEREPLVATTLVLIILVVVWGGGALHVLPHFAGSPLVGVLGVIGALLMLGWIVYMVV